MSTAKLKYKIILPNKLYSQLNHKERILAGRNHAHSLKPELLS